MLWWGGQKKKIDCCSFTAESEREKEEWIEAVQESIAETLSDYEVAEKIWFNEANRSCADCHAPRPEWASVNLGVVICKKCAGKKLFFLLRIGLFIFKFSYFSFLFYFFIQMKGLCYFAESDKAAVKKLKEFNTVRSSRFFICM